MMFSTGYILLIVILSQDLFACSNQSQADRRVVMGKMVAECQKNVSRCKPGLE